MSLQIVADVGNSETVIGLLDLSGLAVHNTWRVSTLVPRTSTEYEVLLATLLPLSGRDRPAITRGAVGSVVPSSTRAILDAMATVVDGKVHEITSESRLPIRLDVEEPHTVGVDRLANTLAAATRFKRNTLAVDLGTATTFDCITAGGVFLGGVIAPGLSAGLDWLARSTAKLPRVDLSPPRSVIGRRTEECIRSGVFYGAVDAVEGIVARIRESWQPDDLHVVATGGYASVIGPHVRSVERVEPDLTLQGLGIAASWLEGDRE